ncbi:MAG: hypothetical protein ACLFU0_04475 [Alphaproteobacteria bacterium]
MRVDVALSHRRVSGCNDAERLLLWALRHRVAAGDPASPHLVSAFGFMCGANAGHAQDALNRLVDAFETFARRPLAFLDWCNRAVTEDEAVVLALCAELQLGRAAPRALDALVVPEGAATVRAAALALVDHFATAGLHLPPPVPTTSTGEHDVADHPFTVH